MDFGTILDDALAYTKQGVFENTNRWLKLIIAILCHGIPTNGYVMRIYRGEHPAPEVDNWGTLFVDGLKLMIVGLIYTIPVFLIWTIAYGSLFLALLSGSADHMNSAMMPGWTPNIGLVLLMYLIEIVLGLIVPVALIRFARTNSFSEAFNVGVILYYIGKIGWINYIIALILVALVIGIPIAILVLGFILLGGITMFMFKVSTIAILGFICAFVLIILILSPLFTVFQTRYMTRVYDSAVPEG
ncbi:MAG: DUF4013 domain-containing protein [Methanoregula sp.]|nr:DUF4013 domain-containing protein [Methanoregula sp.]